MKEVIILGNNKIRKEKSIVKILKEWTGELWACNHAYLEDLPFTKIGSVHPEVMIEAETYRVENKLKYRIMTKAPVEGYDFDVFQEYFGWSTGMEFIKEAYQKGYDRIILAGFKFEDGFDIYQPVPVVTSNFEKQFIQIINTYDKSALESLDNKNLSKMIKGE